MGEGGGELGLNSFPPSKIAQVLEEADQRALSITV
jgi:hypothetical protein